MKKINIVALLVGSPLAVFAASCFVATTKDCPPTVNGGSCTLVGGSIPSVMNAKPPATGAVSYQSDNTQHCLYACQNANGQVSYMEYYVGAFPTGASCNPSGSGSGSGGTGSGTGGN